MSEATDDHAEYMNANRDGWCTAMDLRFTRVTTDGVEATIAVGPQHLQAYGLVHGGVYAGMIETLASVGAALHAMTSGKGAVGLENTTSFVHAVRSGTLHGRATPLTRGRRSHVWQVDVTDDAGKLAATGRVRLLIVDPGTT